jgi:hypothetical protein
MRMERWVQKHDSQGTIFEYSTIFSLAEKYTVCANRACTAMMRCKLACRLRIDRYAAVYLNTKTCPVRNTKAFKDVEVESGIGSVTERRTQACNQYIPYCASTTLYPHPTKNKAPSSPRTPRPTPIQPRLTALTNRTNYLFQLRYSRVIITPVFRPSPETTGKILEEEGPGARSTPRRR